MINKILQVADLVGKSKESVWEVVSKFAPQLDRLQLKEDTICSEGPPDPDVACQEYWRKVGENLIDLTKKFKSVNQVRLSSKSF